MSISVFNGFDIQSFNLDSSRSCIFSSCYPKPSHDHPSLEACAVGIDEAGRGPVLGNTVLYITRFNSVHFLTVSSLLMSFYFKKLFLLIFTRTYGVRNSGMSTFEAGDA